MQTKSHIGEKAQVGDPFPTPRLATTSGHQVIIPDPRATTSISSSAELAAAPARSGRRVQGPNRRARDAQHQTRRARTPQAKRRPPWAAGRFLDRS